MKQLSVLSTVMIAIGGAMNSADAAAANGSVSNPPPALNSAFRPAPPPPRMGMAMTTPQIANGCHQPCPTSFTQSALTKAIVPTIRAGAGLGSGTLLGAAVSASTLIFYPPLVAHAPGLPSPSPLPPLPQIGHRP